MRDKIIGFIISVVCFIISFGFVKGQAMALPFVPTDWTWEMYQGLHMLGDLIANDVNFEVPDWVDFNDFDDVKAFLEMIYNEGKKKVAYASIIADMCIGTWNHFLETGEVALPFSESTVKRAHNTGFFQQVADTINSVIPEPDIDYLAYINTINGDQGGQFFWKYVTSSNNGYYLYSSFSNHSWFYSSSGNSFNRLSYDGSFYVDSYVSCSPNILRLDINSVDGSYVGIITNISNFRITSISGYSCYTTQIQCSSSNSTSARLNPNYGSQFSGKTSSYQGTLDAVFSYFSSRFRNIDIYVNGNPWSLAQGSVIDNPLGVEIPQNVIDEVENGKISGLVIDATLPDTDNLVGSIDLGVVMDELREAQANGRTATLDGVRTKDGVRAIDGTVVGTVSKAVAIDVPSTASLVSAADEWGYIPYYPEIPSAFSGTTILSELIDATQTIVPNELIMAIWGLVIILFIIALINIFHK